MAKGQRGKGGQSTATTAANGPTNNRTTKAGNDREDHQNSQQSVKGGQRNQRGGTNRGQNKKEIIHNEEPKADIVEDSPNSNHVNATEKKDAQHSSSIHPKGKTQFFFRQKRLVPLTKCFSERLQNYVKERRSIVFL